MEDSHCLLHGRTAARIFTAAGTAALLCAATAGAAAAQDRASAAHGRPALSATQAERTVKPARAVSAQPRSDGYVEGTDSTTMSISGPAPYQEPAIGGDYGGYIGMTGNWAYREGCHDQVVWSATNSVQANTNYTTYHLGIGTGVYWFMGGPGVDPHYNGTTAEASNWGVQQAQWTLSDVAKLDVTYPVVFEDVEIPGDAPGISPAPDNGWNDVYTSPCSGTVKSSYISPDVDRAEVNGFADYVTSHSSYKVGIYSAPSIWTSIFGTGVDSRLPNTYEWTYVNFTSSLSHVPDAWCLSGTTTCAAFFGGITQDNADALMWQWSGGGGSYNGYGDFDQIDTSRTP